MSSSTLERCGIVSWLMKSHSFWLFSKKIWIMLSIRSQVLFDTLNRYPWSTSQLILNWHPDQYLANTWAQSTLDQQSVDSRVSVNQLMCISWKLVDSRSRCRGSVNRASSKWPLRVSIEGDSIDTLLVTLNICKIQLKQMFWKRVWKKPGVLRLWVKRATYTKAWAKLEDDIKGEHHSKKLTFLSLP